MITYNGERFPFFGKSHVLKGKGIENSSIKGEKERSVKDYQERNHVIDSENSESK